MRFWDEDPFFKRKGPPPNPLSKRTTRVRCVRTAHRGTFAATDALKSIRHINFNATFFTRWAFYCMSFFYWKYEGSFKKKRTVYFEVSFFSLGKKRTSLAHPQEKKRIARLCSKKCSIAGFPKKKQCVHFGMRNFLQHEFLHQYRNEISIDALPLTCRRLPSSTCAHRTRAMPVAASIRSIATFQAAQSNQSACELFAGMISRFTP